MHRITSLGGKRVLVTGGAGVIGRELLTLLVGRGARVLSVDRLSLRDSMERDLTHRQLDLAREDLGFIDEFEPDVIMHLAATFERSAESPEFWESNWSDNVVTSHRLMDVASRLDSLTALVFASSYLVYASSSYLSPKPPREVTTLTETTPLDPRNLCGAAKLYTEMELEFLQQRVDGAFRAVSARIFRVYGRGSRDVISRWIRASLRGQEILVYHRENRFDYIFARDVAEGLLRVAESPAARGAINLGTGRARRIQEVLQVLSNSLPPGSVRVKDTETDDPYEASAADVSRLKATTGWRPGVSLEEGISEVVAYEVRSREYGGV